MKKNRILTLVGISSISLLPIVAVASCSSTTTPESPLEIEAAKFTTSLSTNDSKLTTDEAIKKITSPSEQGEKLSALKSIVNNFPSLSSESNFTLTINSATVDSKVATSVNVSLTITQVSDNATKNAIFTITGLAEVKEVPAVKKEAERFDISLPSTNSTITTQQAIRLITEPTTEALKVAEINKLVNGFPTPNTGFELIIHTGKVDSAADSSINIMMAVKQTEGGATADATFTITGLKAETTKQELERLAKEKLIDKDAPTDKASETATKAAGKISAQTLNTYYPEVTLAKGITYEFQSAVAMDNSVKVTVKITNTSDQTVIDYTFSITNFTSPLQAQANKFKTPLPPKSSSTTTRQAARQVNDVDGDAAKITEINKLVDNFPTVDNNLYTLAIGTAAVASDTATSITIPITISKKAALANNKAEESPITVDFTITPLVAESAQAELQRLANALLTPKAALRGSGLVTSASEAKEVIKNTQELNKYYARVDLGKGVSYVYATSSIDSQNTTILNVNVGVLATGVGAIEHTIKIIFPNATPPTISK